MNTKQLTLALSAALVGSFPLCAEKPSPGAKSTATRAKAAAAVQVDPSFAAARKSFDAGQHADSSVHLKAGAAKMREVVHNSTLPVAKEVTTYSGHLENLAGMVAKGKVKDPGILNQTFAASHQTLARYQHARAEAFLAGKKNLQAGQALNRTADHVELAAKWSGQKLDSNQLGVVKSLRRVAGSLISSAGSMVEGTGTVLKKGLGLITGLGSKIQGTKKPTTGHLGKDAVESSRKVTGGAVKGVGKVGEAGAGVVEKSGEGLKKVGEKVSGKKE